MRDRSAIQFLNRSVASYSRTENIKPVSISLNTPRIYKRVSSLFNGRYRTTTQGNKSLNVTTTKHRLKCWVWFLKNVHKTHLDIFWIEAVIIIPDQTIACRIQRFGQPIVDGIIESWALLGRWRWRLGLSSLTLVQFPPQLQIDLITQVGANTEQKDETSGPGCKMKEWIHTRTI